MARTEAQKVARRAHNARPDVKAALRAYRARNAQKYRDATRRWSSSSHGLKMKSLYRMKRKYGITPEAYDQKLTAQGGVCAICKRPDESKNRVHRPLIVDHNHTTGQVRELLCSPCNVALGMLREDPALCAAAGAYLARHM